MPLDDYKKNLKEIVTHNVVKSQAPKIILVTPPPVCEYLLEEFDPAQGTNEKLRTATHTKSYADACREVAMELGVAVLDLWSIFMKEAGWSIGHPLEGSKEVPQNMVLKDLLRDGKIPHTWRTKAN